MKKYREQFITLLTVGFILFWLYVAGLKLYDFNAFKDEMNSQIFSRQITGILIYTLPAVEIIIALSLVYATTRLLGMILSFSLIMGFTVYVGLALLNVYDKMPCNCAGLLGNSTWGANFILNLFITAVAALGLIITLRDKERRTKGMRTTVSHAPLPA